ncbi:MAG: hypothetical protein FJ006_12510 [Chloroflexi bacterium]|nr:hypothetical protein [Chloroflexota bacterium]
MKNKAPEIQAKLNGLCEKMRKAGYKEFPINKVIELVNELEQRGVLGIDEFLKILSQRLSSGEEEYRDILREGRFARILARNGFKQIEIEYAKQGPDVKAHYNKRTVYFEIRRIRENEEDKAIHRSKDGVGGISPYRIDNLCSIIQDKKKQLKSDELNIVVLWSDTGSLGDREFDEAVQEIQQEIDSASQTYRKLSGLLFTRAVSYNYGILE